MISQMWYMCRDAHGHDRFKNMEHTLAAEQTQQSPRNSNRKLHCPRAGREQLRTRLNTLHMPSQHTHTTKTHV